jgi:hypothetical protein
LLKSASDGCGLCRVFRHCFLYKYFMWPPYNLDNPKDLQAVQDYLLAEEPRKDSYHANEYSKWRQENDMTDKITRKRWYEFVVEMYRENFPESGIGHEEEDRSGFSTLKLVWEGSSIRFLITSEPGKSNSMSCLHLMNLNQSHRIRSSSRRRLYWKSNLQVS